MIGDRDRYVQGPYLIPENPPVMFMSRFEAIMRCLRSHIDSYARCRCSAGGRHAAGAAMFCADSG